MRMCGGKGEIPTGCNNITKYEDKNKESLGFGVDRLDDMTGVVCVCEEENCNVQQSGKLKLDQLPSHGMFNYAVIHYFCILLSYLS